MGAVSESAESCFLLEEKEHTKSESLSACADDCGDYAPCRAARISARDFGSCAKDNPTFQININSVHARSQIRAPPEMP
jgi:hypothetical protein